MARGLNFDPGTPEWLIDVGGKICTGTTWLAAVENAKERKAMICRRHPNSPDCNMFDERFDCSCPPPKVASSTLTDFLAPMKARAGTCDYADKLALIAVCEAYERVSQAWSNLSGATYAADYSLSLGTSIADRQAVRVAYSNLADAKAALTALLKAPHLCMASKADDETI